MLDTRAPSRGIERSATDQRQRRETRTAMIWGPVSIAIATFFALALGGADHQFAAAAIMTCFSLVATAALAFPVSREAVLNALIRYRFAVGAWLALVLFAAITAGIFGGPSSITPHLTSLAGWSLVSLGVCAIATAAVAEIGGRDRVLQAILVVPIVLALAILVDQLDGGADFFGLLGVQPVQRGLTGPFNTSQELGAAFALFVLLAAFAAIDEIRRRPAPGAFNFPPLSRRLLLPVGSALISFNVLVVSGAHAALAATILGVLVMWATMTTRLGGGANGAGVIAMPTYAMGAAAIVVIALLAIPDTFSMLFAVNGERLSYQYLGEMVDTATLEKPWLGHGFGAFPTVSADDISPNSILSGFRTPSTDLAVWRVEAGFVGIILGLATIIGYLAAVGFAKDRGRRPGRGLALGLGVVATCLIAGVPHAILSTPGIAHLAALILGLAGAYIDDVRARRQPATPAQFPEGFAEAMSRTGLKFDPSGRMKL